MATKRKAKPSQEERARVLSDIERTFSDAAGPAALRGASRRAAAYGFKGLSRALLRHARAEVAADRSYVAVDDAIHVLRAALPTAAKRGARP
jgi:hypothetical protein